MAQSKLKKRSFLTKYTSKLKVVGKYFFYGDFIITKLIIWIKVKFYFLYNLKKNNVG